MIPILYESNETAFNSNGLGRLQDCINCVVTEERNGIYECDFEYPVDGDKFNLIKCGRIVGVTHDDSGGIQPFDIVSYTKPIDGIVTFHAVHVSYRQSKMVVAGTNISSLSAAFALLTTAAPVNQFTYWTDKTSAAFMAAADGLPRTVKQLLGGVEGSILDAYGGEYEWDMFTVRLWASRGQARTTTIRYGVNMTDYNDETDYQNSFTACVPYWNGAEAYVVGDLITNGAISYNGRSECVPVDFSSKFQTKPTKADLNTAAAAYLSQNQTNLPAQTINVSFIRLDQSAEYSEYAPLMRCSLCDTVNVIFPRYGMSGTYKIVRTVWNVLESRYDEMELGALSVTLSEALGLDAPSGSSAKFFPWKIEAESISLGTITGSGDTSGTHAVSKAIGVAGWEVSGTRATYVNVNRLYVSGATIYYQARNMSTSAAGPLTLTVRVIKNIED